MVDRNKVKRVIPNLMVEGKTSHRFTHYRYKTVQYHLRKNERLWEKIADEIAKILEEAEKQLFGKNSNKT